MSDSSLTTNPPPLLQAKYPIFFRGASWDSSGPLRIPHGLLGARRSGAPSGVNVGGCGGRTHLALATHSMVTSEVPATTLVFLGGMMMAGAMGSAGPPTSGERNRRWESHPSPTPTRGTSREIFVLMGGVGRCPEAPELNLQTLTRGTLPPSILLWWWVSAQRPGRAHGRPQDVTHPTIMQPCPPLHPPS